MEPMPSAIIARENAVLDRLRDCQTLSDVSEAAAAVAPEVKALEADDPVFPTIARNMVRYLRLGIGEGWLPITDRRNDDGMIKSEPVKGSRPVTGSNATPLSEE